MSREKLDTRIRTHAMDLLPNENETTQKLSLNKKRTFRNNNENNANEE